MKNTLTINHANRTIVMDRTFAKLAQDTRSDEYAHLQAVRKDYPNYTVVQRHIRTNKNKNTYKGLTYEYMESYIMTHGTEETRLVIITRKPESAEERLKEIMFRLFDLDTQTGTNGEMDNGTTVFACFLHFMMSEEIAETMPWDERYDWLEYNYGVKAAKPCLNRWANRLIKSNVLSQSIGKDDAMWWMTCYIDGKKHRYPVDDNDPELLEYQSEQSQIYANMLKQTRGNWKVAFGMTKKALWQKYQCCYYQCKCLQMNGITNDEIELVLELVEEIVDAHFE